MNYDVYRQYQTRVRETQKAQYRAQKRPLVQAIIREGAGKEYDNKMYVAIDGTPMIDAASLNVDIITALQSIRETISRYTIE